MFKMFKMFKMFGRDEEKTELIKLLGDDDGASSSKTVHVLPIVGMGGVGKTTLVQDVYKEVKNQFKVNAWVCVSDNFDVKRLAKEIIESAQISKPPDFYNLENLDRILDILKCGLTGEKFLIVLDDVWNEEKSEWEKLHSVLNAGNEGSKVIVTTRSEKIAKMMGTTEAISLGGLADEEFWKLFSSYAFGDENTVDRQGLESVGKQIAKKLGGNPLAARTVGALLSCDLNIDYWREVLDSNRWHTEDKEGGIISALRLSYDYLPSHLKQCFIFCSVFPKDYRYKKDKLIQLWSSHEYLLPNEGETGLNELVSRSFIQAAGDEDYVIHDLLHDLAQSLSDGEIFSTDNKDLKIPKRVRHISINAQDLSLIINGEFAKENLRSLVVFDCAYSDNSFHFLSELEGLRVLVLHGFDRELPSKSFRKMLHSRHLHLNATENMWYYKIYEHKLPNSICKLYHMQYLHVKGCAAWPKDINKLINLRDLDDNTEEIAWMGKLTKLESLYFRVNQNKSGFEISQLRDMTQLRILQIKGLESVKSKEQASEAMLGNKQHLKSLKLYWSSSVDDDSGGGEVLEGLLPYNLSSTLQELVISGCNNIESLPKEVLPTSLQVLTIYYCNKLKSLPEHGLLPTSLQELGIYWCPLLKEACRQEDGPEWHKIAHIPKIKINRQVVQDLRRIPQIDYDE